MRELVRQGLMALSEGEWGVSYLLQEEALFNHPVRKLMESGTIPSLLECMQIEHNGRIKADVVIIGRLIRKICCGMSWAR